MKHFLMIMALVLLLASPAFAQFRFDLGADMPFAVGAMNGWEVTTSSEATDFLTEFHFPFPEASVYYQFDVGPLKIAPGIRAFTFIVETIAWPNVLIELPLGPVFIDAQFGGGLFGYFGLANGFDAGKVFFPDLSVWLGLGKNKNIRLGAGALGLLLPEITTDGMLLAFYAGAKISLLVE